LIEEELQELKDAIKAKDKVAYLDAVCDLAYVVDGLGQLAFGAENYMDGFERVHLSNMTKFCQDEQEAIETCEWYRKEKGVEAYYTYVEDVNLWVVRRKDDGKVLKSVNYEPVHLNDLVND